MVVGRRAFERGTASETTAAIVTEEPAELDAIRLDLRRIVARCLEKEPDARFQSARDLAFSLRAILESGGRSRSDADRAKAQPATWPVDHCRGWCGGDRYHRSVDVRATRVPGDDPLVPLAPPRSSCAPTAASPCRRTDVVSHSSHDKGPHRRDICR